MRKLYEIFKIYKVQKIIVSAETIRGNTVFGISNVPSWAMRAAQSTFQKLKKYRTLVSPRHLKPKSNFSGYCAAKGRCYYVA